MISRQYAERYFPEFVKKVDKEIKQANKRAKEAADDLNFRKALRSKPRQKVPRVVQTADLVNEGMTRYSIADKFGISLSGVATYISEAKSLGLIARDKHIKTK